MILINQSLHDKVEFEVAICNFGFDFDQRFSTDRYPGFSPEDRQIIRSAYKSHMAALVDEGGQANGAGLAFNEALIEHLRKNPEPEVASNGARISGWVQHIRTFGTLPFARLARLGFVAVDLLNSAKRQALISDSEFEDFFLGLETIAGVLESSRPEYRDSSSIDFLSSFGHLRPNTYDITSPRYDQLDFFRGLGASPKSGGQLLPPPSSIERPLVFGGKLEEAIQAERFGFANARHFQNWCERAIVMREYSKYVFSGSLSALLEEIVSIGQQNDLTPEDLSFFELGDVEVLVSGQEFEGRSSREVSSTRRSPSYIQSERALRLPALIVSTDHAYIAPFQISKPNFVGRVAVEGDSIFLSADAGSRSVAAELEGKIVLIERADPGFDWIFARRIKGLITKYGGPNSHMAIRCAEFAIPAAIGCGETLFEKLAGSRHIVLDPGSHRVVGI